MDWKILVTLIVIVTVVAVASILVFNNMNPKTSEINGPLTGLDNQTVGNNSDNFSSSNLLLTLIPNSGDYTNQSTPNPPSPPDPMDHVISLFDAYIKSNYNQSLVPAAAVVIVQNNKILYMKTFGVKDIASGEPVDENTLFGIGSATKQFTATNVAQLVSAGLMNWDDPITKYYNSSEFQLYDPAVTGNITIRDCFTHRSGYATNGGETEAILFNASYSKMLYNLRYIGNTTPFRNTFQYFNTLYALPGYCAAKQENTTWNDLIKSELLDPLGMTTATTTYGDFMNSPNHATPYLMFNATLKKYEQVMDSIGPAGSMACSISEMANWLKFQIADTGYYDGVQIVSKKDLDETRTGQINLPTDPPWPLFGSKYGFGWMIGNESISHGGDSAAFHTMVRIYQSKGLGIAIFANGGDYAKSFRFDLTFKFNDLLHGNETITPWNPTPPQHLPDPEPPIIPAQPLSTYVGMYYNAFYGNVSITQDNGLLIYYCGNNSCPYNLSYWNENRFFDSNTGRGFIFDVSNGTAQKFTIDNAPDYIANTTYSIFNRTNST